MQPAARRLLAAAVVALVLLSVYAAALYARDRPYMQTMYGAALPLAATYAPPALPQPACAYAHTNPLGEGARASSELGAAAMRVGGQTAAGAAAPGRDFAGLAWVPTAAAFAGLAPPPRTTRPLDAAWTSPAPAGVSGPWSQPNRNKFFEWDAIAARPLGPMWTPGVPRTYDGDPSTQACYLRGDGRGQYPTLEACQLWVGSRPSWPAL